MRGRVVLTDLLMFSFPQNSIKLTYPVQLENTLCSQMFLFVGNLIRHLHHIIRAGSG